MAVIKRIKATHGAKIRVKKGQNVTAPKKSLITISTGGNNMAKTKKKVKKKVAKKPAKPAWNSLGVVDGPIEVSGKRQVVNIKRPGVDIAREVGTHVRSRKVRDPKAKKRIVI